MFTAEYQLVLNTHEQGGRRFQNIQNPWAPRHFKIKSNSSTVFGFQTLIHSHTALHSVGSIWKLRPHTEKQEKEAEKDTHAHIHTKSKQHKTKKIKNKKSPPKNKTQKVALVNRFFKDCKESLTKICLITQALKYSYLSWYLQIS